MLLSKLLTRFVPEFWGLGRLFVAGNNAAGQDELGDAPELGGTAGGVLGRVGIIDFAERAETAGAHFVFEIVQNAGAIGEAEGVFAECV